MNIADVLAPNGTIDPERVERVVAESKKNAGQARVVVREWDSKLRRHNVLMDGPLVSHETIGAWSYKSSMGHD